MTSQSMILALAILGSSFWGSWHCAAMCGPVASLMAHKRSLMTYHLGRGASYIFVGALGGYLGSLFLQNDLHLVRIYSGYFFAALLVFLGIQTFRGRKSAFSPRIPWLHSFYQLRLPGIALGLLSVFLPCGWLYSYLLAAAATQSPMAGALVMTLFWFGGLPALSTVSIYLGKSIQLAPEKKQMMAALVLVFAGLYSLVSFYFLHRLNGG